MFIVYRTRHGPRHRKIRPCQQTQPTLYSEVASTPPAPRGPVDFNTERHPLRQHGKDRFTPQRKSDTHSGGTARTDSRFSTRVTPTPAARQGPIHASTPE
ncbi:MAG: hypothetical protein H7833_02525 [Magnetococcus sp. DMHC-1]